MILKDLLYVISKNERERQNARQVQGMVIGVSIAATGGIIAGMMLAQKSGKELRRDIVKAVSGTVEKISSDIKEKATDVKEDLEEGFSEVKKDVKETAENISDDMHKNKR